METIDLAGYLVETGVLKTPLLINAFSKIERAKFMPAGLEHMAGLDEAMPIGHGQTISQPYTVAFMLELLQPHPGHKVLDVGSGSGWTTTLLACAVGQKGQVYGVEKVPALVETGQNNLKKFDYRNAKIVQAGNELGLPEAAPFERILVSAASDKVDDGLVTQLKPGGRLVMPVRESIVLVTKDNRGQTEIQEFRGFVFVPLLKE